MIKGKYDEITFNNIAYFQIVNGLEVTGWVDSRTHSKLFYGDTEEIAECVPQEVELEDLEWEEIEETKETNYIVSSLKQIALGNFTEDVTLLGTGLQIGMGIFGVDLWADVRDITADIVNWEWTKSHAGKTTIDVIALVPVIGGIKYFDEAALLVKNSDEILLATKHVDEVATIGKQVDEVISQLKNTGNFASGKLKHIFSGEINKNTGKAVGFHYEGLSGVDGKVTKVTKQPNKYGVYEAEVTINGEVKSGGSTFFPKNWTPQQVVDAINEAFSNKTLKNGNLYQGTLSNGMNIRMAVINGKITTAYPIY